MSLLSGVTFQDLKADELKSPLKGAKNNLGHKLLSMFQKAKKGTEETEHSDK